MRSRNGPNGLLAVCFEQFPQVESLQACYNPIRYFKARCGELTKVGGGCPPTFGGTSVLAVACRFGVRGCGELEVPPRGWRNLQFRRRLAEPPVPAFVHKKTPDARRHPGEVFVL